MADKHIKYNNKKASEGERRLHVRLSLEDQQALAKIPEDNDAARVRKAIHHWSDEKEEGR